MPSLGPCGKPEDIPHAKVEGSSYNYKDTLIYTCERGYALNGHKSRTCGEGGTWSNAPKCSRKSSYFDNKRLTGNIWESREQALGSVEGVTRLISFKMSVFIFSYLTK